MASSTAPRPDRGFDESVEALLIAGAARGAEKLRTRNSFGLPALTRSLIGNKCPVLGILTGFPIFLGDGSVTFENDGPIGAGHVAFAAASLGWRTAFVIEPEWRSMAGAIADTAARLGVNLDPDIVELRREDGGKAAEARLREIGITHLLAIERPGAARDGRYYSMRGQSVDAGQVAADFLFQDVPWVTGGFADGGNEIGMGRIGARRIATAIENGATIASRTRVDHLTLSGVSNWGAYGFVAMLTRALPAQRDALLARFTPETDRILFDALEAAGAVDGVMRAPTQSVDGIALEVHHAKIDALRQLVAAHTTV